MGVPLHNRAVKPTTSSASAGTPSVVNAPAKAVVATPAPSSQSPEDDLTRAVWSTAKQNDLPDSSFAYVAPGGKKDSEGKTTPRSLRYLPYKDADGAVDAAHVRNALARLDQANIPASAKASAKKKLVAAAKSVGVEVSDDSEEDRAADPATLTRAADHPDHPAQINATFYAPIMRRDDDNWEVEGVLTSEAIDTYGTIFDYESAKRAVEAWAGNVREMHQLKAVGRRIAFACDDANRQITIRTRISKGARDTWEKVVDGTLTGYSIGAYDAKKTTRVVEGRAVPVYTDYKYGEVSLVDVPSNPDAAASGLVIARAASVSDSGEDEVSDQVDDLAPDEHPTSTSTSTSTQEPEPADTPSEPAAPAAAPEPTAEAEAPAAPEQNDQARVASAIPSTPVAPFPGVKASVADILNLVPELQSLDADRQTMLVRALGAFYQGNQPAQQHTSAPVPTAAPPAITPHQAVVMAEATRASIGLGNGAGFAGNDLDAPDTGADPNQPIGKAMLQDDGQAHSEHTHPHGNDYDPLHLHAHTHAHQDGTSHSHPHMHNHAHHDHFGDPAHSHPHTHTHDHSHEYRAYAPDLSHAEEPQPVQAIVGDPAQHVAVETPHSETTTRAASHAPFSGTHSHSHPAFGSQGDDETHEHEHSHDNDADHSHSHEEASGDDEGDEGERAVQGGEHPTVTEEAPEAPTAADTDPLTQDESLTRAGQRISADTRTGLHEAALAILRVCGCPVCQDAISLYDPDDDGDDDVDAAGDTDQDMAGADSDANDESEDGNGERLARQTHSMLTRRAKVQRIKQVRLTRRAVETALTQQVQQQIAPITQQLRAITARLTAVNASSHAQQTNAVQAPGTDTELTRMVAQQDELRASMEAVRGLVERIAAQPASPGPYLRAADKTLALGGGAILDASAPLTPTTGDLDSATLQRAVQQLQRNGHLRSQDEQISAATAILTQQMREGRR